MSKKHNKTVWLRGFLPAFLVLLGWISFISGQLFTNFSVTIKTILLVVARVLPQGLNLFKNNSSGIPLKRLFLKSLFAFITYPTIPSVYLLAPAWLYSRPRYKAKVFPEFYHLFSR